MKKYQRYLSALKRFDFAEIIDLDKSMRKAIRYFLCESAGFVTAVAIDKQNKGRIVLMGNNPTEFYCSTVVGESLAQLIADADYMTIAQNPQGARLDFINIIAYREFHTYYDLLFNNVMDIHGEPGSQLLYESTVQLRKDFMDDRDRTVDHMRKYMLAVRALSTSAYFIRCKARGLCTESGNPLPAKPNKNVGTLTLNIDVNINVN